MVSCSRTLSIRDSFSSSGRHTRCTSSSSLDECRESSFCSLPSKVCTVFSSVSWRSGDMRFATFMASLHKSMMGAEDSQLLRSSWLQGLCVRCHLGWFAPRAGSRVYLLLLPAVEEISLHVLWRMMSGSSQVLFFKCWVEKAQILSFSLRALKKKHPKLC